MPNLLVGNYSYLLSAPPTTTGVPVTSYIADMRRALNYTYAIFGSTGPSAAIGLDASHDGTAWLRVMTVTAVSANYSSAQISGYFPYFRGVVHTAFGGGGGLTGSALLFVAGGLNSNLG